MVESRGVDGKPGRSMKLNKGRGDTGYPGSRVSDKAESSRYLSITTDCSRPAGDWQGFYSLRKLSVVHGSCPLIQEDGRGDPIKL